ncbi:C-reactive protein [Bombina bombina]|uniref:C-reactive protein n=1 Tax=Bombina bombina TaxID=8345 RepID=UPI00235ABA65|nr:C-reactive protein [Bombina bombina]
MERILLAITLFAGTLAQQDLGGKVFLFPKATSTAYVTLHPTLTEPLTKLTTCLRSYTELNRHHSLLSLAVQGAGKDNTFLIFPQPPNFCSIHVGNEDNRIKTNPDTLDWKHTCVTWDSDTGVIQLWINGKLYPRRVSKKGFSINTQTSIILGQEQDSFGGGFDINQSFVGEITDVHMWDYVLEPLDIQKYFLNAKDTNGNVISWNALQYDIKGDVIVQPKIESLSERYK